MTLITKSTVKLIWICCSSVVVATVAELSHSQANVSRPVSLACKVMLLCPLRRQDNEDLDRLIVAADTGLLRLTCLLFDSEWFWDNLMNSWTDYLMSPFKDYPLDNAQ